MDKAAHEIMRAWDARRAEIEESGDNDGRYYTEYHEDRLYSVYDAEMDIVSLVYAKNPKEAIGKVKGKGISVNQVGNNNRVIGFVENMAL